MAAITGRWTALEDITLFSIGGKDVAAIYQDGSLEITAEEIDVSALRDAWNKREYGRFDWRVTCRKLIEASPVLLDLMLERDLVVVSLVVNDSKANSTFSFVGTGMITGAPMALGNPMTEEVTIVSAGDSPTITINP